MIRERVGSYSRRRNLGNCGLFGEMRRRSMPIDQRAFFTARQHPDDPVVLTTPQAPFAALIWGHDGVADDVMRERVAGRLLGGGLTCERWHDWADSVLVSRALDHSDEEADAAFVMTTWHTDESVGDVASFFVFNTAFDGWFPERFLVVDVGRRPVDKIGRCVRSQMGLE